MRLRIFLPSLFFAAAFLHGPLTLQAEEPLAQPGFMERPGTLSTLFGFTSLVANLEPGLWGALLITEKQGIEIRDIWWKTQGRRISESLTGPEAKELERQFAETREEILTPDQKDLITTINKMADEVLAEVKSGADSGASANEAAGILFRERLPAVLSPEQLTVIDSFDRMGP